MCVLVWVVDQYCIVSQYFVRQHFIGTWTLSIELLLYTVNCKHKLKFSTFFDRVGQSD